MTFLLYLMYFSSAPSRCRLVDCSHSVAIRTRKLPLHATRRAVTCRESGKLYQTIPTRRGASAERHSVRPDRRARPLAAGLLPCSPAVLASTGKVGRQRFAKKAMRRLRTGIARPVLEGARGKESISVGEGRMTSGAGRSLPRFGSAVFSGAVLAVAHSFQTTGALG